jgi:3'-phosphoadenosine 5'-phosphosulfate sulfotransferase (PAPS reductase)/FAD synthetase
MNGVTHVIALSGGKDSTALALRMAEVQPDLNPVYLCTPTGRELPEMDAHWARLEEMLSAPILRVTSGETFEEMAERNKALPSWRMRFCTRELKIEPTLKWLREHAPAVMYVGLRADEPLREGIYGAEADIRFPLREWGWGVGDVLAYLRERGVRLPGRTDCDCCPYQRLNEWKALWRRYPERYAHAEALEEKFGATFRSPGRDSHPAALKDLRREFEAEGPELPLIWEGGERACDGYEPANCRVCSL